MIYKKITSLSNPLIRKAVDAKLRRRSSGRDIFLAEGPHLAGMAAAADAAVEEVFYTDDFIRTAEGGRLLDQLACMRRPPEAGIEVTDRILARISDTESPQGIVVIVSHPPVSLHDLSFKGEPLIVACDGIQDPGNLGTIIRVSDAAGTDAVVILPGTCDPYSSKTVRATSGSIFNIPVVLAGQLELVEYLASRNITFVITDVRARKSLYDFDLRKSVAFAFGNEARGVSESLGSKGAESVKIPIPGKAESLNAAVAASVCLYEAVRQRTTSVSI